MLSAHTLHTATHTSTVQSRPVSLPPCKRGRSRESRVESREVVRSFHSPFLVQTTSYTYVHICTCTRYFCRSTRAQKETQRSSWRGTQRVRFVSPRVQCTMHTLTCSGRIQQHRSIPPTVRGTSYLCEVRGTIEFIFGKQTRALQHPRRLAFVCRCKGDIFDITLCTRRQ